jgi:hypothetical protein
MNFQNQVSDHCVPIFVSCFFLCHDNLKLTPQDMMPFMTREIIRILGYL